MNTKQAAAFPLRMPPDLRAQLEDAAAAAGRSTNHEIVDRLLISTKTGASLSKSVVDVVTAAAEVSSKTFEEALMYFLVLGMQSSNQRQVMEARLETEEARTDGLRHLLSRCALTLANTRLYFTRLTKGPREEDSEHRLAREIESILRDFSEMERKATTAKIPRSSDV